LAILYLSVTRGSVTIPITDGRCPESDFGLYTERKGPVVTYENNVPTEGPNYLGRIQLMNISNGCTVVIHNVTKEDTETVYYTDGLPGQLRIALKMTSKKPPVHFYFIFFALKGLSGTTVEVYIHLGWSH
jgi:hypothetical protein